MAIFTGTLWIICSLLVPETYAPVLLRKRAAKLSQVTGRVYLSKLDVNNRKTMSAQFRIALSRPWLLLFREPIVFLTAIYMAVVYGTLYMMFAAFPIVFQEYRGWSAGIGGLAFTGVTVGMSIGVAYAAVDNARYARVVKRHGGSAPPEARLPPSIIGSALLPVGLFWFAFTNGPSIHWIVSIIASGFFATGLVLVFLSLMNYLIDSYVIYAASAMAANSVMRSLFGAAFPLFATRMYDSLGIHWASAVPAFLAVACAPFPWLFYRYGAKVRARCRYAAEAAEVLAKMREQQREEGPRERSAESDEEAEETIERRLSGAAPAADAGAGNGEKSPLEGRRPVGHKRGRSDDELTVGGHAEERDEDLDMRRKTHEEA